MRVTARHRAETGRRAGDLLIRAGAVVFAFGVVAVVGEFTPFFFGHSNQPLWLALLCFLVPLGLGLALWGLLRQARAARRRSRRERESFVDLASRLQIG